MECQFYGNWNFCFYHNIVRGFHSDNCWSLTYLNTCLPWALYCICLLSLQYTPLTGVIFDFGFVHLYYFMILLLSSLTLVFSFSLCAISGLVSDAFHLTFGCGLLTFSLFAIAVSRNKPDQVYTYG